jgi:hypothetical protein
MAGFFKCQKGTFWTFPQLTPSGIRQQQTTLLIIIQPQIFQQLQNLTMFAHPGFGSEKVCCQSFMWLFVRARDGEQQK